MFVAGDFHAALNFSGFAPQERFAACDDAVARTDVVFSDARDADDFLLPQQRLRNLDADSRAVAASVVSFALQ